MGRKLASAPAERANDALTRFPRVESDVCGYYDGRNEPGQPGPKYPRYPTWQEVASMTRLTPFDRPEATFAVLHN